ncbi:MAG TPA: hypothetical protein VHQ86_05300 [Candidatus Saccharimonadia bacterium]|jgi:hypothetical protein|nr:hypothetical protein [Candidatus Saccharimonadia bacterium]
MSETDPFKPDAAHSQGGTNYGELFAEAQSQQELVERSHKITFQPGDICTLIVAGGPVQAEVRRVETETNQTNHHDYEYVTVVYDQPTLFEGRQIGTHPVSERIRADKLALMQISDADIQRVTPQYTAEEVGDILNPKPKLATDIKLDL